MFHVRTLTANPLLVNSLSFLADGIGEDLSYSVHTKRATDNSVIFGTAIEPVDNLTSWTQVAQSNVVGKGLGAFTHLDNFATPVYIPGNGAIQTFYLTLFTAALRYRVAPLATSLATLKDHFIYVMSGTGVNAYPATSDLADYSDGRSFVGQ
eukprot:scaffold499176_cov130-Attheya_sp.AAC.1